MSNIQSAKQATQQLLERLDENVTYDDIMYEVYVLQKIERGFRNIEDGRILSHEEAGPKLERWLK
jgi:predicted transcriptional regulator